MMNKILCRRDLTVLWSWCSNKGMPWLSLHLMTTGLTEAEAVQYNPAALVLDDLDTAKDIRSALISGGQLQPPPPVLLSSARLDQEKRFKTFYSPSNFNL